MVSLKEIAECAKVNISTASTALNDVYGSKRVSEKKRNEIKQIAKQMGYIVDDMARALTTGKSKVIGLIVNNPPDNLIRGFNLAAEKRSFLVKNFLVSAIKNQNIHTQIDKTINIILNQRLAGVIIHYSGELCDKLVKRLEDENIYCVVTNTISKKYNKTSCFNSNDRLGGAIVADYFLRMGHTNFACIGDGKNNYVETLRMSGFMDFLINAGISVNPEHIIAEQNAFMRVKKTKAILAKIKTFPLAIFCASSYGTISTLTLCLSAGLKVPHDISIAGYGNHKLATIVTPSLTSVKENLFERGFEACEHLINMIENNTAPKCKTFNPQLIIRESCVAVEH